MAKLKEQSSIVDFVGQGDPAERYIVTFRGKGLFRDGDSFPIQVADVHRVEIRLGIDYPRSRPDLQWLTKIYHPNISAVGAVCLGGFSTNWVPSLNLDELCEMLWDMLRYKNYDPKSAYNYQAAKWCETQTQHEFPLDARPLRDKVGVTRGDNVVTFGKPTTPQPTKPVQGPPPPPTRQAPPPPPPRTAPTIERPKKVEDDILVIDESSPEPPPRPAPQPRRRPLPKADDDILIIE